MTENKTILIKGVGVWEREKREKIWFFGSSFVCSGLMQTADNVDDSLEGKGE